MSDLKKRIEAPRVDWIDPVSHILFDAADYMERHGYCLDEAEGSNGEVCFILAINAVMPEPWSIKKDKLCEAVWNRFRIHVGHNRFGGIIEFQQICRSKEQAVAALRGAGGSN